MMKPSRPPRWRIHCLIAFVIGKRAQIHDSLWETQKRHAIGRVKNMESLFKFVKSVDALQWKLTELSANH
jgi:hypothetical protein